MKKLVNERLVAAVGITSFLVKRELVRQFFKGAFTRIFFYDQKDLERFAEAEGDVLADNVPPDEAGEFADRAARRQGRTLAFCYSRKVRRSAFPGMLCVAPKDIRLRYRKQLIKNEVGERADPAVLDYLTVALRAEPDEVANVVKREALEGKLLAAQEITGTGSKFGVYEQLLKLRERTTFRKLLTATMDAARCESDKEVREIAKFARALYRRLAELRLDNAPPDKAAAQEPMEVYLAYRDYQVRGLSKILIQADLFALREVAHEAMCGL